MFNSLVDVLDGVLKCQLSSIESSSIIDKEDFNIFLGRELLGR